MVELNKLRPLAADGLVNPLSVPNFGLESDEGLQSGFDKP